MAGNHITDFISGFGGGTRQNRFVVTGDIGGNKGTKWSNFSDNKIYIRTSALPASTLGGIPINYRGRSVIYPGERVYAPWQITVLDDVPSAKKKLYEAFHAWSNEINDHGTNTSPKTNGSDHFSKDWSVEQLDTNGAKTIRQFDLKNCWPVSVGEIGLDMGTDNTLSSFAVTMAYSHFEYKSVTS